MRPGLKGLLVLTMAAFLAAPAAADWLVMKDGSRVETDGPWEVKGRLIVFTSAGGSLASLRSSDVDLEASERATEEALRVAQEASMPVDEGPPAPGSRPPVLVLTDADVGHVLPEEQAAESEEETEDRSGLRLVIGSWDQEDSPDGEGVAVVGTLRNDGVNVATRIEVRVQALNSQGEIVGTTQAELSADSLGSGDVLNFRAQFPALAGFDTARFDISGREFLPAPTVSAPEELSEEELLEDLEPEPAADPF